MEVNVIILNWNAPQDTIQCVAQFASWRNVTPNIWVVDNASEDDSVAQINQSYPDVNLIQNEVNQGFAGGSNRGLEAALEQNDAPLLLLNNDAQLSEETLIALMNILHSEPEVGIVGPLLYEVVQDETIKDDTSSQRRLISAGSSSPVMHIHNLNRQVPTSQPAPVDYISGSVALIRASVLREIGLLDEAYFFTGEIADLCRRAKAAGYLTMVDTQSAADHELERSKELRNTLYTYYIVRNRFLYMRKFYTLLQVPLWLFWAAYGLLLSVKLRLSGNKPTAVAVQLGTFDGALGRFGGQNQRVLQACNVP